jgi:hypothetical protein
MSEPTISRGTAHPPSSRRGPIHNHSAHAAHTAARGCLDGGKTGCAATCFLRKPSIVTAAGNNKTISRVCGTFFFQHAN